MYFLGEVGSQNVTRTISTRLVKASWYWKCLRFWYFISDKKKSSLWVYYVKSNYAKSRAVWSTADGTDRWKYVQVPLIQDGKNFMVRSDFQLAGLFSEVCDSLNCKK